MYRHRTPANVDLKGFTEEFYRKLCLGHLQPVLETLVYSEEGNAGLVRGSPRC